MPAVSVVLPTHQRVATIGRSIASVLAQTYADLELIVVDDGSTDGTAALLRTVSDTRLRTVRLERRRGAAHARNVGIGHARASHVAFQDSDDEWLPDKLARQMEAFDDDPGVGVVYTDMYRVLDDGGTLYHRSPDVARGRLVNPETRYWQTYMLGVQSTVVRRACFARCGLFDTRLPSLEDMDLFLRIARSFAFVHVSAPLVRYFAGEGLSTDRAAELDARHRLVAKHALGLLREDPLFALRETVDVVLKRSLLPVAARHVAAIDPAASSDA